MPDFRLNLPEPVPGQHVENELDKLLREQRMRELKFIHNQAVNLRENATDIDEALKEIEVLINTLRALAVEVSLGFRFRRLFGFQILFPTYVFRCSRRTACLMS